MRIGDRPLPVIALDAVPMIAHWPIRPVIAVEALEPFQLWDETPTPEVWDDAGVLWDDLWRDATCSWTGCEIDTGVSDDAHLFPSTRAVVQLDNRDGVWSLYNADGTPALFGPGQALDIWAHRPPTTDRLFGELNFGDEMFGDAERDWWLFSGTVARWDHRADDTVEIEAFDAFSDLAQPIGTYTPGSNGQRLSARLSAILSAAGESALPHRFATGDATLTAQQTDAAPLEEMQVVAGSDGGVLFVDADGTLVALDRTWRAGRTDRESGVPVLSDNVCNAEVIVWDAVISTNDEGLADKVVLENIAKLQALAGASPGFVFTQTEQQWTTQIEGNVLAQLIFNDQSPRRLSLDEFDLYLNDPLQADLWKMADLRRLDKLRFIHEQSAVGGVLQVDVQVLVDGVVHEFTPDGWLMSIASGRAITYELPSLYDTGLLYDTGEEYGYG